jgi:7-cyano-7-deazaguanine synthase
MKAIVLLSGGLDSTTMLRIVQEMKYEVHAITFSYGQRHSVEIDAAKKVAQKYGIQNHRIVNIDLFGGSALTDNSFELNKSGKINAYDHEKENIPLSYVPARNTIFLSYALGFAEVIGAQKIFIGINAIDYSGYPDCRPEYLKKFNELAKLATAVGVKNEFEIEVAAPLMNLSKAQIIATGIKLGVDYGDTISCYDPDENGVACGKCDACTLRLEGFAVNKMIDNARYAKSPPIF